MIEVRELSSEDDIKQLVSVCHEHQKECASKLPYDPKKVTVYGESVLWDRQRVGFNTWIAWEDGKAIGYAVGTCSPQFFCELISANLTLIYVLKEKRGSWAYIRMIAAYERWAMANGAKRIVMGVTRAEEGEAEKIAKLFPRLGYEWFGDNYVKEMY